MNLDELRLRIDETDAAILPLFLRRLEIAHEIGEYKKANNLPVYDPEREAVKLNALTADLNEPQANNVREFFNRLFAVSRKAQEELL